jgi:hypothetical protein
MKIRTLLFLLFLFGFVDLHAQADSIPTRNVTYFNSILAGALIGEREKGTSASFTMEHGIRYRQWSVSGGCGYDAYSDWSLMPLFGSVVFDFARVKNSIFFVQGYAGHSVVLDSEHADSDGGLMLHPAVGYRLRAGRCNVYLVAGYKFQRVHFGLPWIYGPPGDASVKQETERVSLQIGFGLN